MMRATNTSSMTERGLRSQAGMGLILTIRQERQERRNSKNWRKNNESKSKRKSRNCRCVF